MKKLIALLAICGFAWTFVACGTKTEQAADNADSTTTEDVVVDSTSDVVDTTAVDSAAVQ